jgi:SAM-dependent methyltransferase
MSFKFNFSGDDDDKEIEKVVKLPGEKCTFEKDKFLVIGQVVPEYGLYKRTLQDINYSMAVDEIDGEDSIGENISFGNDIGTENIKSDLISGVYEGGFKTWECSLDLVNMINTLNLSGKRVIELGCGSGLPGISCIKRGANVDFQDYNHKVLKNVTVPNILINTDFIPTEIDSRGFFEVDVEMKNGNYYCGDWSNLIPIIQDHYDIIVTSETIYNADSIPSLLELSSKILAQDGYMLVAAKYYFGCSGSLELFKQKAMEFNFKFNLVFSTHEGVKREIIKLYK